MSAPRVFVVETGIANMASVYAGLKRSGVKPEPVSTADGVARAERVVLPGVGSFGSAMETLRAREMDFALRERIERSRPTLAICLGLQLLAASSEESPGVRGLGVVSTPVTRLRDVSPIPHMGWNRVAESTAFESGYAYFANSFAITSIPPGWNGAVTEYGVRFVAAMERGPVMACQFHPELSGAWGQRLLTRWLEVTSC